MALINIVMAMLTVVVMFQAIDGTIYKVGDSAGWTTIGNIDYKQWTWWS